MFKTRRIVSCLCVAIATLAIGIPVTAKSTPDILVTPAIVSLDVDPGTTKAAEVTLVNSSAEDRTFEIRLRSFNSGDNDGKPYLDDTLVTPLHDWLAFETMTVTLPAKQHQVIKFTLTVPPTAGPGSYRTALLFADKTPLADGTQNPVTAELGPLLFVRVSGEVVESAQILAITSDAQVYETLPVNLNVNFANTGNVDILPIGTINITPKFAIGSDFEHFDFNPTSSRVLAGSSREISSQWHADNGLRFGYFEAEVVVAYGEANSVITAKTTFWVLPWKAIAAASLIGGLVLVLIVLRRRSNLL